MPQISVIVPVYKAEAHLRKCVNSILAQTLQDIEVILVDDGSPDRSGELCDQFSQNDARVKVIHQENCGVAAARNCGLDAACGEYYTFVDSDDYIESRMYQCMMEIAVQYDCDVVMCDCIKEFGARTEVYTHDIRPGYYSREQIEKEYFPHLLMMPNVEYPPTISNGLCLCRRNPSQRSAREGKEAEKPDMLQQNKPCIRYLEGIRFSEDLLFGAELIYHANSFYYMKEQCLYHYCMNPQSATHTFAADKWKDYVRLHGKIQEKFGSCEAFDFSHQIDLVLLFFVYNAVSDLIKSDSLTKKESMLQIKAILNEESVRTMFGRLKVHSLPLPLKPKILTWCYKYNLWFGLLYDYLRRR